MKELGIAEDSNKVVTPCDKSRRIENTRIIEKPRSRIYRGLTARMNY